MCFYGSIHGRTVKPYGNGPPGIGFVCEEEVMGVLKSEEIFQTRARVGVPTSTRYRVAKALILTRTHRCAPVVPRPASQHCRIGSLPYSHRATPHDSDRGLDDGGHYRPRPARGCSPPQYRVQRPQPVYRGEGRE